MYCAIIRLVLGMIASPGKKSSLWILVESPDYIQYPGYLTSEQRLLLKAYHYSHMDSVVILKDGTIKIPDKMLQEYGIHSGDSMQISNEKGTIILKPIYRLNNLKGAFPIKGWKDELKNMRDEWSNRTNDSSSI